MQNLKFNLKILALVFLTILLLGGFTGFSKQVPGPKDVPKRTEDKNAGIVIPAYDATPYDIIEKSYDNLYGFMLDSKEGIFMGLSTSNFDTGPHRLTFLNKKLGFVAFKAYRINISFVDTKKPQKMFNFSFSPFEITEPKSGKDVMAIAESWTKFFDSLGWKRAKAHPWFPYGRLPDDRASTYMGWETVGLNLSVNIILSAHSQMDKESDPKYYITIVLENPSAEELPDYK